MKAQLLPYKLAVTIPYNRMNPEVRGIIKQMAQLCGGYTRTPLLHGVWFDAAGAEHTDLVSEFTFWYKDEDTLEAIAPVLSALCSALFAAGEQAVFVTDSGPNEAPHASIFTKE